MIWSALLAGGLSALSGFGAQQSAKKQAREQRINDFLTEFKNRQAIDAKNDANRQLGADLGQRLINSKLTTTERTQGSVTNTSGSAVDNYSYVDVDGMMEAADRAGFNPVTFLNAGGLQAYTQTGSRGSAWEQEVTDMLVTHTSKGHNAAAGYSLMASLMSPEVYMATSSQATKIPSTLEVIGDAGTTALNAYRSDMRDQANKDFQSSLLDRQLSAINNAGGTTAKTSRTMYVPSTTTSGGTTLNARGGQLSANPYAAAGVVPDIKQAERYGFDTSNKAEWGNPFQHFGWKDDPSLPASSAVTDWGGEPMEWLYAPIKVGAGAIYTMDRAIRGSNATDLKQKLDTYRGWGKAAGDLGGYIWENYYAPGFGIYPKDAR